MRRLSFGAKLAFVLLALSFGGAAMLPKKDSGPSRPDETQKQTRRIQMDAGSNIQLLALFAGSVTISGGTPTVVGASGGYTLGRTSPGLFTLTAPVATNETPTAFVAGITMIAVTMQQSGTYSAVVTSATVITISTFAVDGVTATDKNFSVIVWNRTPEQ